MDSHGGLGRVEQVRPRLYPSQNREPLWRLLDQLDFVLEFSALFFEPLLLDLVLAVQLVHFQLQHGCSFFGLVQALGEVLFVVLQHTDCVFPLVIESF